MINPDTNAKFDIRRFESQEVLFSRQLSRSRLLSVDLGSDYLSPIRINVWKNHSIEPVLSLSEKFINYAGFQSDLRISAYDDSFTFDNWRAAEIELIWLDPTRFSGKLSDHDFVQWIKTRLLRLRSISSSPIVVCTWNHFPGFLTALSDSLESVPGVYFADLFEECQIYGVDLLDQRTELLAGTIISKNAQLIISRKLACHWIIGAVRPSIKAIAVDLDNTFYAGVLGEDGISGVKLLPAHASLHNALKAYSSQGIFLSLLSKNEQRDVEELFKSRTDFGFCMEEFSSTSISWVGKDVGLSKIAADLRISTDSILVIDDNLGELMSIASRHPFVNSIYAGEHVENTVLALEYFPGLWRWNVDSTDTKRLSDLRANRAREEFEFTPENADLYFNELQVRLSFFFDNPAHIDRAAALSQKTNQFNLALRRFQIGDIAGFIDDPDYAVITISAMDRLADSGIIGLVIAKKNGDVSDIIEVCISCRALGRRLEDTIILHSIAGVPFFPAIARVNLDYKYGPRNSPALEWLEGRFPTAFQNSDGTASISTRDITSIHLPQGINLIKFYEHK